jgi:arachidonate 15-lipoxygenase
MCKLFETTVGQFDLRWFNPEQDAELRGIKDLPVDMPAYDNRVVLLGIIRDHVVRFLAIYYPTDGALQADEAFGRWLDELDRVIPHGVRELAGDPVTLDGAAELLATLVYMGAVEHELIDSGMWDYQLWNDVQPVRVHRNGQRVPLDVYQRLVNWNFSLNVDRTLLTTDFSDLAPDEKQAQAQAAFGQFRQDLLDLQQKLDQEPFAAWRMEPRFLKANINY